MIFLVGFYGRKIYFKELMYSVESLGRHVEDNRVAVDNYGRFVRRLSNLT